MKKAFSYMFLDNKLHTKLFCVLFLLLIVFCVNSIISFYSNGNLWLIFLASVFGFIGYILLEGYKISIIKFLDTSSEKIVFPIIGLKKMFTIGSRYVLSFLIFSIPLFCIVFAFAYAGVLSSMTIGAELLIFILGFLAVLSIIFCLFCIISIVPAATLVFLKTNSIWSFYKFEEIFVIISVNPKKYVKYSIVIFLLDVIWGGLFELTNIVSYNSLLLSFVLIIPILLIVLYVNFVNSYLIAKLKNYD